MARAGAGLWNPATHLAMDADARIKMFGGVLK
jgi:hypothetical protein